MGYITCCPLILLTILTQCNSSPFLPSLLFAGDDYELKEVSEAGKKVTMTWMSTNVTSQFNYFDSLVGEGLYFLIFNHSLQPQSNIVHVNNAVYFLLDPKYIDKKMAIISIPMVGAYNNETEGWEGTALATVELYDNFRMQGEPVYVPDTTFIINENFSSLNSSLFSFTTTYRAPIYQPLLPWIMMIPNLFILLCLQFVQLERIPPAKLSLVTVFVTLNFLLFASLLTLYYGVVNINNPQGWLILTGVMTFVCVIKFVHCFETVINRINIVGAYLRFYTLTFMYMWFLFTFWTSSWFIVVNSLILVPQIVHNAYQGIKPGFHWAYLGTMVTSQVYILYYKGCPANIMSISPSLGLCIALVLLLAAQIVILYAQYKLGSRFFVPRRFIPGYYKYEEEIEYDLTARLMIQDCAICLLPLCDFGEEEDLEDDKKIPQFVDKKVKTKILKTPCKHKFHVSCLEAWMQHKMECPVDRLPLPPYEN